MAQKTLQGELVVEPSTDKNRFNLSVPKLAEETHGEHRQRTEALVAQLQETFGDDVALLKKGFSGGETFMTAKPNSEAHAHLSELAAASSRSASR